MSKRIDRPIPVTPHPDGSPRVFMWRDHRMAIRDLLDAWEEAGCWWLGETPRWVFRVLAGDGAVYDVHHHEAGEWRLYRVVD